MSAITEPCPECGISDALGRHGPTCDYAIRIGLPRLAEGEEAIDPDAADLDEQPTREMRVPARDETVLVRSAAEFEQKFGPASDRPGAIERAPAPPTELWFSYTLDASDRSPGHFDVIVFDSELDALRHAVFAGEKVHRLELGRSLREQVNDA